jgi:hypothetical protein
MGAFDRWAKTIRGELTAEIASLPKEEKALLAQKWRSNLLENYIDSPKKSYKDSFQDQLGQLLPDPQKDLALWLWAWRRGENSSKRPSSRDGDLALDQNCSLAR